MIMQPREKEREQYISNTSPIRRQRMNVDLTLSPFSPIHVGLHGAQPLHAA